MTEPRHERRQHYRGKPRPGRRLPIRYRIDKGAWIAAETRNIGVGGAFVSTSEPARPGSAIELELEVPTCERPLVLKGQVRWAQGAGTAASPDDPDGPGMGVQFQDVDIDVLLELNDYFASLTGTELG